jgi:hypothetical protein
VIVSPTSGSLHETAPPSTERAATEPLKSAHEVAWFAGDTPNSNAPMSQCGPCGRATPRWSAAGQSASLPASIAGLPAASAIVGVGLPLSCSGPSCGSPETTPMRAEPQVPDPIRSFVPVGSLKRSTEESPPALPAMIVLSTGMLSVKSTPRRLPETVRLRS